MKLKALDWFLIVILSIMGFIGIYAVASSIKESGRMPRYQTILIHWPYNKKLDYYILSSGDSIFLYKRGKEKEGGTDTLINIFKSIKDVNIKEDSSIITTGGEKEKN